MALVCPKRKGSVCVVLCHFTHLSGQFLVDFNLFGMSFLHLHRVKVRKTPPLPDLSPPSCYFVVAGCVTALMLWRGKMDRTVPWQASWSCPSRDPSSGTTVSAPTTQHCCPHMHACVAGVNYPARVSTRGLPPSRNVRRGRQHRCCCFYCYHWADCCKQWGCVDQQYGRCSCQRVSSAQARATGVPPNYMCPRV